MSVLKWFEKIKNYFSEKKTIKILKKYRNAMFEKEKGKDILEEVSFVHLYPFSLKKSEETTQPFSIVLFLTMEEKSQVVLDSIMPYFKNGVQILVLIDQEMKKFVKSKYLKKITKRKENHIFYMKNTAGLRDVFKIVIFLVQSEYILFLTGNSFLKKTLLFDFQDLQLEKCSVLFPNKTVLEKNSFSLNYLSGTFFNKEILLSKLDEIEENKRFWFQQDLVQLYEKEEIAISSIPYIGKALATPYFFELFAYICQEINKDFKNNNIELASEKLLSALEEIISTQKLSKTNIFLLAVSSIFFLCRYDLDDEKLKEKINNKFRFGKLLEDKRMQYLYNLYLPMVVSKLKKKYDAVVIETYGMDDILNSDFYKKICENFSVRYLKKRTNFDYYVLNNMLIKMYSAVTRSVISSGSLNKKMLVAGTNLITLWHGLGLLKETVVKKDKFTVGKIICSSVACQKYYKKHFFAKKAIGLGSIQTDILFDEEYVNSCRKKVRSYYGIDDNEILAFFAPTFRIGKYQYYNFYMDIEELSLKLKENNIKVLARKHYIFEHVQAMVKKDTSGIFTSKNRAFEIDTQFNFTELVSACDVFITDYSSGIFYAAVLWKPLVLYAPDYKEYAKGNNGFILPYPKSFPANAVLVPDPDAFISAIQNPFDTSLEKYQKFREKHVGSCDGHVNERVYEYFCETLQTKK